MDFSTHELTPHSFNDSNTLKWIAKGIFIAPKAQHLLCALGVCVSSRLIIRFGFKKTSAFENREPKLAQRNRWTEGSIFDLYSLVFSSNRVEGTAYNTIQIHLLQRCVVRDLLV